MAPEIVLLWLQIVTEIGALLEGVGRRVSDGTVTREELESLRNQTQAARARWDAAAASDRK